VKLVLHRISQCYSHRRANVLSICAADFGHPLLLAVSTNVERYFKLLQYSPSKRTSPPLRETFRLSSSSTLEGVSRNPNRSHDHLLSAPDRENTSDSRICIRRVSMCDSLRDPTGILPSLGVFLVRRDLICPMHAICKGDTRF